MLPGHHCNAVRPKVLLQVMRCLLNSKEKVGEPIRTRVEPKRGNATGEEKNRREVRKLEPYFKLSDLTDINNRTIFENIN